MLMGDNCSLSHRTQALSTAERWLSAIRLRNRRIVVLLCMTKADLLDPCEVPRFSLQSFLPNDVRVWLW